MNSALRTWAGVVALWLIGLSLIAQLVVSLLWPHYLLGQRQEAYLTSSKECHEARSAAQVIEFGQELTREQKNRLKDSNEVALSGCLEVRLIGSSLRASGVSAASLVHLDLVALSRSDISVGYLSEYVAGR